MTTCIYCTPEWFEESARLYRSTPRFQKELQKVTAKVFYRIEAESDWGIERDFIFGAIVDKGELQELAFFSEEKVKEIAEYIMSVLP